MNTDTQQESLSPDLQRWLADPLATNEAVDLGKKAKGRFLYLHSLRKKN